MRFQPGNSKVLTTNGYRYIKDIKVSETIYTHDLKYEVVVWNQIAPGTKDLYEVNTDRLATVVLSGDALINMINVSRETNTIRDCMFDVKFLSKSAKIIDGDYFLPPIPDYFQMERSYMDSLYYIGYLLGKESFTPEEAEVMRSRYLVYKHPVSYHIPERVKYASNSQFIDFAKGLMSTRGELNPENNTYTIELKSERFAKDIKLLFESRGQYVKYFNKDGTYFVSILFIKNPADYLEVYNKDYLFERLDKITSVKYLGEGEVYDIRLKNVSYSYIAESYIPIYKKVEENEDGDDV